MDIDRACMVLARFVQLNQLGKQRLLDLLVRSTRKGLLYEAQRGLTSEEAEAVDVWVREALK